MSSTATASSKELKPYNVKVSYGFIYGSLLSSILIAFAIGRTARIIFIDGPVQDILESKSKSIGSAGLPEPEHEYGLPHPKLISGKEVPRTLYTAKNFDTAIGSSSASMYLEKDTASPSASATTAPSNSNSFCSAEAECTRGKQQLTTDEVDEPAAVAEGEEEEEYLPAGQHLLVDMKHVDSDFLNSEVRLAEAMVSVVNESKLTLLSYHCHKLIPMGVSCVGVLLESHISFHTWPKEGVITLDLFTCGAGELIPVLPNLERLFAVPQVGFGVGGSELPLPQVHWTHKMRGFAPQDSNPLKEDLGKMILERTDLATKEEVGSTKTIFQRIDIFDTLQTEHEKKSYDKSQSNDESYESLHPEQFLPEREIFLDGVLQSTRRGNEPYHEALVHPAMFTHSNPKKVGIIGGGEGATLKEVLKHDSLEKVKMIEIDEAMVYFCKEHLPEWNSCKDIVGSTDWCGHDERAEIYYEDGLAWFNNRFSDDGRIETEEFREDPFDVLIMDALDPQDNVPFADMLYTDKAFIKTLYNALSEDGIIVMQLGDSPTIEDPPEEFSRNSKRNFVMNVLEEVGFDHVHVYEEGHCKFRSPWSFAVAMKGEMNEKAWHKNAREIDVSIHKRIRRTISGEPSLKNFDGGVMTGYNIPPKGFDTVYCRTTPTPESCVNDNAVEEVRGFYDPHADRNSEKQKIPEDILSSFQKMLQ